MELGGGAQAVLTVTTWQVLLVAVWLALLVPGMRLLQKRVALAYQAGSWRILLSAEGNDAADAKAPAATLGATGNIAKCDSDASLNTLVDYGAAEEGVPAKVASPTLTPTLERLFSPLVAVGAVLVAIYLADVAQVFAKTERHYSRDFFVFICGAVAFLATRTVETARGPHPATSVSRVQTDEWKGWMQIVFLLYHYFAAREAYNLIRILIAAYVWLTGFGNFSYFYRQRDFSAKRLARMLFRLNFLVAAVAVTTDNAYMLYYICPMHTYWFLSVYVTMGVKRDWNTNPRLMWTKLALYALFNAVLFELNGAEWVFSVLGPRSPVPLLSLDGSLHEWLFRVRLDRWMCLYGMICAYMHPTVDAWLARCDERQQTSKRRLKAAIGIVLGVSCAAYAVVLVAHTDKFTYNRVHPFLAWIPLTAYLYLRNYTAYLRSRHAPLLAWCGRVTLETYLLQFHVWLVDRAKSILLLPGFSPEYPLLNFVAATALYLYASRSVFSATNTLAEQLFKAPWASTLAVGGSRRLFAYRVALLIALVVFCSLVARLVNNLH